MGRAVKTEAIVLRSMRYGEADRILHLYTPGRGRVGAIAKGVRRARSRFGGRLEPFFRLRIELHEGRGELLTVTGAQTVDAYARLREDAGALDAAARACDAVGRLFETTEPHPGVFNLLCRELALLDERAVGGDRAAGGVEKAPGEDGRVQPVGVQPVGSRAGALAFRLKLLLAAGLAPQLGACASCGERDHLVGFSGAAGGVVCAACEAGSFALGEHAYRFMTDAFAAPLHEAPDAPDAALGQVERAISSTLEHHANLRLMPASRRAARIAVS
ncbi:MAG: repair protein RecO [Solirubrobacteraceae bacterium]|jgi:DNA repair protein RecO (recombination protein O)|nr:repair protein RecO [Solirubrobacteraceae bacterium]